VAFELTGINELIAELERRGNNVEQTKKRALNEGATLIKNAMKQKCPRSTKQGQHLADNIIVSDVNMDSSGKAFVEVGPKKSDNNEFFYGKFLEWGTVKQKATPFAEPGFLEKRQAALDKIAEVIRGAIQNG
jgi:HK97 gp10 family phage protein